MSVYRQQLEEWLSELEVNAMMVLDVGGAQGEVSNRVKEWQVTDYEILDLPKYDLHHQILDESNPFSQHLKADIVFCLEVFEYIFDPATALKNIKSLMLNKAKAYITFPLVYPVHQEVKWDSLRYTEQGIRRLAFNADLSVKKIVYRKDRSGLLEEFYRADGMRAARGEDHSIYGYIVEFQA